MLDHNVIANVLYISLYALDFLYLSLLVIFTLQDKVVFSVELGYFMTMDTVSILLSVPAPL